MKPYLLLIVLTALVVAGAAWLPDLDLTRIETGPAAVFTLTPPRPLEASDDGFTVKMSVIRCGNPPHDDPSSRIGRWPS